MFNFDWNLIWIAVGAIGGVIGALGTTSAVIVALWQTVFSQRTKLLLHFDENLGVMQVNNKDNEYIGLVISNVGNKNVQINNWGFVLSKKIVYVFGRGNQLDVKKLQKVVLPYTLPIGEKIQVFYKKTNFQEEVTKSIDDGSLINPFKPLKFFVVDYAGKYHYIKDTVPAMSYYIKSEKADKFKKELDEKNKDNKQISSDIIDNHNDLSKTIVSSIVAADEEINRPHPIVFKPIGFWRSLIYVFQIIFNPKTIPISPDAPIKFLNVVLSIVFQASSFLCLYIASPIMLIYVLHKILCGIFNVNVLGLTSISCNTAFLFASLLLPILIFGRLFWLIGKSFEKYQYSATYVLGYSAAIFAIIALFI